MPKSRPPSPRLTEKEREYRALFEEAEERGASLAQLAVEKDISVGTISWWRSEIRRPVPSPVGPGSGFEVALPGGAVVRVPDAFEEASLVRVLRAVRAAC